MDYTKLIGTVGPLVAGYLASRQSKKSAEQAAGGARLQQLTPQIMAMLQQQLANSNSNYQMQQQQYQANQPLQDSVRSMAMNLTPNHLKAAPSAAMPMQASAQAAPQAPAAPPQPTGDFLDDYQRRGGGTGGVLKGAVGGAGLGASIAPFTGPAAPFVIGGGALAGAIGGAFNKHASSAPTDFAVGDAQQAIQRAIQAYQGRTANPGEVTSILQGQGWEPGDRWVGDAAMRYVLQQLQAQGGR